MNTYYLVFGIGLILGLGIMGLAWGTAQLRHLGKTWILTLPEIPGTKGTLERKRVNGGFFDRKSNEPSAKRSDNDRILPAGPATYPTNMGPVQVMTTYGASVVVPSKEEAATTIEAVSAAEWIKLNKRLPTKEEAAPGGTFAQGLAKAQDDAKKLSTRFRIWDPLAYYKACRESVMQKLYQSAGGVEDPWYAKAALAVGIAGLLGILALLAFVMVKVMPLLQSAASGA